MKTIRCLRLAAIAVFSATLAACGGGQSGAPALLPATTQTTATPQPGVAPMSIIAVSTNTLTVTGTIVELKSGGFLIQGGKGLGYYNVATTASTTFTGAKPFVGETIEASGTGSAATSMTASSVSQLASVSGSIVALKSGGFEIQGGPGVGYLNIWTNSSTIISGSAPFVGESVTVSGTGSVSTSITAFIVTQTTTGSTTSTPAPSATSTPSSTGTLYSVTGAVVQLKTGGFLMQGGAGIGYINIYTTSSTTYTGTKPYAGETVKAVGTGSLATSLTAISVAQVSGTSATPTPAPTVAPTAVPTTQPATSTFMPSSYGKISAFQVFDNTSYGYISQSAAAADGYRYSAVWGARNNIGTAWLTSNPSLQTGYYNALATDESPTGWGSIGHTLSWWQTNHPDWVLYSCTSAGAPTTTPAWIPGLPNVPLDIHNPAVVDYQIRLMANYAHSLGYRALAIDEATFWQAGKGVSGGHGCGIYQNGSFVQRYAATEDANYASDVVAWVKRAHALLTTDATISTYHLKLIVNHPENPISANEQAFLANVDADLNEDGFTWFGSYKKTSPLYVTRTIDWAVYAQKHGVAVLTDDNFGSVSVGTPQLDYSIATYLLANEGAESVFAASANGFGLEQWHSQYTTTVGAPCGEYYSAGDSANPGIYYRRFANAIVVVNAGSSAAQTAHLPSGHTYADILGRAVGSPLSIDSNDGYVLLTSNGCQ